VSFFRYDSRVQNTVGQALPGVSVAVLSQPANTTTQPGSPLATLYSASTSNAPALSTASWLNGQLIFTLTTTPPADVVAGSYLSALSVNPAGYDGVWQIVSVTGDAVTVTTPYTEAPITNPGTYVSGGTLATSALPNPLISDNLGNYFFYAAAGVYTVQLYGSALLNQEVYPDQEVVSPGGGSVTSVALTGDGVVFNATVSGSPITTSGTFVPALLTQNANTVFSGPSSGGAATPTFRSLVAADFPGGTGTVSSVAYTLSVPAALLTESVTGSPVTSTGTIAATVSLATQTANEVFASATSGGSSTPAFRALVAADLPGTLLQSATVALTSANILALDGTPITLVAAPGAGKTIFPVQIIVTYTGGSSAYTDAGGAVSFAAGSLSQALSSNAIFLTTVSPNSNVQVLNFAATATAANPPSSDNAPLTISKITNNFAAGNGTASITVLYTVQAT
jgi:hypothetical protein